MPWLTVAESDVGGRDEQQDRYLVAQSDDASKQLLVVADGAGGHLHGAAAAQAAIDCVADSVGELWNQDDPEAFIEQLIQACNEQVLQVDPNNESTAYSTLVLVYLNEDEIFWGHVGDSRLYLIREGQVVVRTRDHTMLELQGDAGNTADANKLYMCLGSDLKVTSDISSSLVKEGDTLLLCSDGLWGQLDIDSLAAELSKQILNSDLAQRWVKTARSLGGSKSDNITLVAARFADTSNESFNPFKTLSRLMGRGD